MTTDREAELAERARAFKHATFRSCIDCGPACKATVEKLVAFARGVADQAVEGRMAASEELWTELGRVRQNLAFDIERARLSYDDERDGALSDYLAGCVLASLDLPSIQVNAHGIGQESVEPALKAAEARAQDAERRAGQHPADCKPEDCGKCQRDRTITRLNTDLATARAENERLRAEVASAREKALREAAASFRHAITRSRDKDVHAFAWRAGLEEACAIIERLASTPTTGEAT